MCVCVCVCVYVCVCVPDSQLKALIDLISRHVCMNVCQAHSVCMNIIRMSVCQARSD